GRPPSSHLFPYTTLFRSRKATSWPWDRTCGLFPKRSKSNSVSAISATSFKVTICFRRLTPCSSWKSSFDGAKRNCSCCASERDSSQEHTSELPSQSNHV